MQAKGNNINEALLPEGMKPAHGLYNPAHEHDACGVGFIANIKNEASHKVISDGLLILKNLEHRGAVGADPKAGDGAGILIQIPHGFFNEEATRLGFPAPAIMAWACYSCRVNPRFGLKLNAFGGKPRAKKA
jgi:glutamate synthase (NADPH/NADH) large chain